MAKTSRQVAIYLSEKRAAGAITRKTEQQQRGILYAFAEHCPQSPAKIHRRDVLRWLNTITGLSANTRRLYYGAAHCFCQWLQRRGLLSRDPFAEVPRPKVTRPIHRALDVDQVGHLLGACESPRDRVLILVALHTGLRRAELAALEVGDVSLASRTLTVRSGKGGHSRIQPLAAEAVRVIASYIAEEGLSEGPLLRSLRYPQQGITGATVGRVFREVAYRSGVKIRARDGVATHAARHSFATDVYTRTRDVLAVQQLLGHSQLNTTARYVRGMDVEGLRSAVEGRTLLMPRAVARTVSADGAA